MNPLRKRERSFRQNSAVNVTPLVDVMLVLLVIFMVTAPMMTTSVNVDLPSSTASRPTAEKDPIIISLDVKQQIFIQDVKVAKEDVISKLQAILKTNPGACVYVRGDKNLPYKAIMELMSFLADSGIEKVALIAEAVTKPASPAKKS